MSAAGMANIGRVPEPHNGRGFAAIIAGARRNDQQIFALEPLLRSVCCAQSHAANAVDGCGRIDI